MAAVLTEVKRVFPPAWTATIPSTIDQLNHVTGELTGSFPITPLQVIGTATPAYGAGQSGMCLNLRTNDFVAGRRVRGRMFLVPMSAEGYDADGTLKPSFLALVPGMQSALLTGGNVAGVQIVNTVVWHRPVNGAGGSIHDVTTVDVADRAATLRSRSR
jgi:hypothetical protein